MNPTTNPEAPPIQDYQVRYEKLIAILSRNMGGDMEYVNLWLNSPHTDLAGITPQFFIDAGKIEVVESLAWAIEHCLFG